MKLSPRFGNMAGNPRRKNAARSSLFSCIYLFSTVFLVRFDIFNVFALEGVRDYGPVLLISLITIRTDNDQSSRGSKNFYSLRFTKTIF